MTRIFFFFFGFGLMTIGFVYVILYLNLLNTGYSLSNYVNFITRRFECYFILIGLIIMNLSMYIKGDKKYELRLRYSTKFPR